MDVAVNAIILNSAGRVLLTKRRDTPIWCLPGGRLEPGETLPQATVREVREEIGIEVSIVRLTGVYSSSNVRTIFPASTRVVVVAFECKMISGIPQNSEEVSDIDYFPFDSLPCEIIETHPSRIADALARFPHAVYE